MTASRLGVLGGTFDPIHNGHLLAAAAAKSFLNLDEVLFVPAGDPWQKRTVATPAQRLEMTELAVAGTNGFRISKVDIARPGASYTIDTLSELRSQNAGAEVFFILGSDSFNSLPTWKNFERLFELATFAVLERPGYEIDFSVAPSGAVVVIPARMLNTSSTECREMIAQGRIDEAPIPAAVADFIKAHRLYRSAA